MTLEQGEEIMRLRDEIERLKARHCKDCCCARSWQALGVTDYTGMSIPEHIERLRAALEAVPCSCDARENPEWEHEKTCAVYIADTALNRLADETSDD
jgi:hypothetical protein